MTIFQNHRLFLLGNELFFDLKMSLTSIGKSSTSSSTGAACDSDGIRAINTDAAITRANIDNPCKY